MNRKQLMVMWIVIGVIGLMCLFPPWEETYPLRSPASYALIFSPPIGLGVRLDLARLLPPLAVAIIVGGALIITFRDRKPPHSGQ